MGIKLFKSFSILIACSFLFIACENMPCDGENCAEQDSFMVERNGLLDRLHAALIDYDLDAPVDIVFEHCTNDDLRSITDLVDCNETPDALDCNDVVPVADVCQRVVSAFIPQQVEDLSKEADCWTVGSWFPETACAPSFDRSVCGRGWGVYTSQARCCMAGQGAFDGGCSLTHDVSKPTHQVDALPFEKGDSRTTDNAGLICGTGTSEVDGACMSDVRCGPDTIYRDGLCISDVTTCSGPDVFQTPDGQCRSAVRAFTEDHCGEGTALIHGICRSIVTECEGPEVGIHDGRCLSRVPAFTESRCGAGTLFAGDHCAINPALPVKCADGTKQVDGHCVAIAGAISTENCGEGTKLMDDKICVALPQKPVIVTQVVQSYDQCIITRTRNNMSITLRGEGIEKRARFACDSGFELVGDAELKCNKAADSAGNESLQWRGNTPQCVAMVPTCGPLASGALPSCFPNCDYDGFQPDSQVWGNGWTKTMEAGYLGADCGDNKECVQGAAYAKFACTH